MIPFALGLAAGILVALSAALYLVARTYAAKLPPLRLTPRRDSRELTLARLEKLDAMLAYAFGDEPYLGARLYRRDDQ